LDIPHPYLLFLGDVADQLAAKTATGIADWRPEWCVGQMRLPGCKADAGIDDIDFAQAMAAGAKTFVIGSVNSGGNLPNHWVKTIVEALDNGLNIASGLHQRLTDIAPIRNAAHSNGLSLFDVRHAVQPGVTGTGAKRTGRRLLTVGTDCSVGKKYTSLALERAMRKAGMRADFRATGQTGIFISGGGVSIDAVIADFISGTAESISPDAAAEHWDVIEGQGSLFHPAFAGVSMGLLHGSQPDAFVVCHEPTRTNMRGVATALPTIQQVIDLTITCGRLTNPAIRCVGLAINTAAFEADEARQFLLRLSNQHDLPATDPLRFNTTGIVTRIQAEFPNS
jgi:uncharacterized NAD-dependent epimerase/dehydratase family protein